MRYLNVNSEKRVAREGECIWRERLWREMKGHINQEDK